MTNEKLTPQELETANKLEQLAGSIHPNPAFEADLEKKLKAAHRPKRGFFKNPMKKIIPSIGWAAALATLAFVLNWGITTLTPTPPQPASGSTPNEATPTPAPSVINGDKPNGSAFDWNGTTLYLNAPFPELPTELPLYLLQPSQHATLESARALADQFGMSGQIYLVPPEVPGDAAHDFLVVDGNQRLQVRSDQYFYYYPDYTMYITSYNPVDHPNAEATIRAFLADKGFNFEYTIEEMGMPGTYNVNPLMPQGLPLNYEFFSYSGLTFQFGADGLFAVYASLTQYAPVDDKTYQLITAQDAFDKLLDNAGEPGYTIGESSPYEPMSAWTRPRRENETVTVWGWMNSYPSAEGSSPLVTVDGYTVTGNITDVRPDLPNTFVELTGRFTSSSDGSKSFIADSWREYDGYEDALFGSLERDGNNVVIVTADGSVYTLPDVPAEVPVPTENIYVTGVKQGDTFEWKILDDRRSFGGGGGGGGGLGFYKINLSGTPVPLPTASPAIPSGGSEAGFPYVVVAGDTCQSISALFIVDVQSLIAANGLSPDCSDLKIDQTIVIPFTPAMPPERFDGQRGILNITIYEQADGGQRVVYGFLTNNMDYPYLTLEGEGLESLQSNNARPVNVWGEISYDPAIGIPSLKIERYEIPFPGLQYQIFKGTESDATVNGQELRLFTDTNGTTYVELNTGCFDPLSGAPLTGLPGDLLLAEALAIPDQTYEGYPTLCVYSTSLAINPKNGLPMEVTVSADQPSVLPEPPLGPAGEPPTLTIERIELVYYVPNQRYLTEPAAGPVYIQPVWRFYGHYSDGSIFEALIQALDPLFLLPETEDPYLPG